MITYNKSAPVVIEGFDYNLWCMTRVGAVYVHHCKEGCCSIVRIEKPNNEYELHRAPTESFNVFLARILSNRLIDPDGQSDFVPGFENGWKNTNHGFMVPTLDPPQIPGTSGGVWYDSLVVFQRIAIARRSGELNSIPARIRMAGRTKMLSFNFAAAVSSKLNSSGTLNWETTESSHFAHSGASVSSLRDIIAWGIHSALVAHQEIA